MSIYRFGRRISYNDLHEFSTTQAPPQQHGGAAYDPNADWTRSRKAMPSDKLLPATHAWLAALPAGVRPEVLPGRYARIANWLCATWNDPAAFNRYAEDLVIDRRGGRRQGFPLPIIDELNALFDHYNRLHPGCHWQVSRKLR
jgi:hypothetical protein